MRKHTSKKNKNQTIELGGMFVSAALGFLETGEEVQISLIEESPVVVNRRMQRDHMRRLRGKVEPVVYFVQEISTEGFIKIGYTSKLEQRMHGVQVDNPRHVRLLLTIPGSLKVEDELHLRFAHCRYRGEWFYPCDDLMAFINERK